MCKSGCYIINMHGYNQMFLGKPRFVPGMYIYILSYIMWQAGLIVIFCWKQCTLHMQWKKKNVSHIITVQQLEYFRI